MPTTFYDDGPILLNTLTNQQLGNVLLRQHDGIEDATFMFWRNQQQALADSQNTIVTVGYVTGPAPTITIAANNDWPVWVEQTQAITQTFTWATWAGGTTAGTNIYMPQMPVTYQGIPLQYDPPAPNPEYEARLAREVAELDGAKKRARALLESMLTEAQRDMLKRLKHFDVIGSSGRRYRIKDGSHGNVIQLDATGKHVARYCGQPNGVPVGDMMLAQKLQIETDEAEFLRLANCLEGQRAA